MNVRLLFLIFVINYSSSMDLPNSQQIVFLNGTTTSGKSSIATELKKLLEAQSLSVEVLSIDSFIVPKILSTLVMERINPWNMFLPNENLLNSSQVKQMKDEAQIGLCAAATIAYKQNKIVIIDAPIYEPKQISFYEKIFENFNVTSALVYCPMATLVERIIDRNEKSSILGQRSIMQALHQFSCFYENRTENAIDQLSYSECNDICDKAIIKHDAAQQSILGFLKCVQNAICPFSSSEVKNMILKQMPLDQSNVIAISPKKNYDCIVNTEQHDSATCAKMIFDMFFRSKK